MVDKHENGLHEGDEILGRSKEGKSLRTTDL